MAAAYPVQITRVAKSRLTEVPMDNLVFGKYFTDHMLEATCEDGLWKDVQIKPYQPITLSPSAAVLHYGQAIFEGIKAFRDQKGEAFIFRPKDNHQRFNISARRLEMPAVPEEIFLEGMRQLVSLDQEWIPNKPDHSLYIRPFMIGTDDTLGVHASKAYKFLIILSPTGPYYAAPMRIYVEERYTRAAPGGVGYAKAAGNYAAAMLATSEAKKKGYDQVLWTDAFKHKYAQEIGTMNVFFLLGNTLVTPGLESETILAGVTRDTAIKLAREMGFSVEERSIDIDEIMSAYKSGLLKEVFGTGTAATISMIRELRYKDFVMEFDTKAWEVCTGIKARLDAIRSGQAPDSRGWMFKV